MSKQQLTNFFFHDGSVEAKGIRVVDLNGEPWFLAKDVCNVLGIQNVTDATRQIKDSRKVRLNLGLPGRAPLRRWSTSTPFPKP